MSGPLRSAIALVAALCAASAAAEDAPMLDRFPTGFTSDVMLDDLPDYPTAIAFARGDRLFVALKSGVVLLSRDGATPTVFLDISPEVNRYGDRGLLGLAVHPDFPDVPAVYLLFVHDPPGLPGSLFDPDGPDGMGARVSRLMRFDADPAQDFDRALSGSDVVLLGRNSTLDNIGDPASHDGPPSCDTGPGSPNTPGSPMRDCIPADGPSHSIGTVTFGRDGSLFVGNGDSSRWTNVDPRALRALDLDSLAGKILRIDPISGEGVSDNPFFDGDPDSNRSKVWSYGFRNPFRFAIHPVTNEPWIGDVGWALWEELNTGRGGNFGWPCFEGGDTGSLRQPAFEHDPHTAAACAELYADPGAVRAPLYAYPREEKATAILAGDFYLGTAYPDDYHGLLFLADHNRQEMQVARLFDDGSIEVIPFAEGVGGVVQIVSGPDTNIYYVILGERNQVRRLRWTADGNHPPVATITASPTDGDPPLVVTFSSEGSYDPDGDPLAFSWNFGDGASSELPDPSHAFAEDGLYRVALTLSDPGGAAGSASVRIAVGNTAPDAVILEPFEGTLYEIGQRIDMRGSATDLQDGALEDASLTWELVLHHADHIHPNVLSATGSAGSFVVDDHGDDTWLELKLTATDSEGLTHTTSVAIHPHVVERHFSTMPEGLELIYQGTRRPAPFTVTAIVNGSREIGAPPVQMHRSFHRWSDGGASSHAITITNEIDHTVVAHYVNHPPVARIAVSAIGEELPRRVELSGAESSDPEGDALTYEWEMGDGSALLLGTEIVHTFETPGAFRVTLTVRDSLGKEGSASVWIDPPPRRRPTRR